MFEMFCEDADTIVGKCIPLHINSLVNCHRTGGELQPVALFMLHPMQLVFNEPFTKGLRDVDLADVHPYLGRIHIAVDAVL
jgi:hypothetical protein